ncbi:ABC transporter substrate-binding protein [Pseudanabaena sp. FACHB-2040]|uniref:ABC transporter substrate-binding protein n=1 Tax=Pseudanabaena sp. FACHB-2040 TaxID=2692859 RepID=UPI00168A38DB|nr:ABC transporter substrate-binding protein [Pseudanabaena sp. FACHB-2040]MBD2256889.1 ABC transporter substrate-binding protein [Pseudanabaena sp. FACHB-2040]
MVSTLKVSIWSAGVLLAGQLLAGCASDSSDSTASAPSQGGSAEQIVLAIGGESSEGYDPTLGWGRYGSPLFQSTLLRRDQDLNIVNDLATGYTVSDDRRTWTVTIRQDAQFSDGEPLTAADVAYTFNKAAESGGLTDVTALEEAVATDDYTVELRLKQPQSAFVNRLITLGIVPQHAHGPDYARNPVGSGPYQMVQWDEGQQLIVEANPNYYGEAPGIQRLVFLFTEEDAAFAAARAGQAQVVSVPQSLAVQSLSGMKLYDVASVDNRGLMFPYPPPTGQTTPDGRPIGNPVTSDLAIRQAVNYAVDRQALVEGVLEGYGSPAYGPVSGLAWEEPRANIEDAQPEQARQILAEGGWSDTNGDGIVEKAGQRAEFTLLYPASDSTRQALALSVAEMLRPVGIQINVEGKSWDEITPRVHSDAVLFGWGSHDQSEMYNLYHSKAAQGAFYNAGYYANEAIDRTLDLAMGAPSEAEAIAFWQAAQWDGEQGFTAKGDAAWAWLVNLNHTYFVSECLDIGQPQVEPHGHGWPITANIAEWTWTCS